MWNWQLEAFRESDELRDWRVKLVGVTTIELEQKLGCSMPTLDSYDLTVDEVEMLLRLVSAEAAQRVNLNADQFTYAVSAYAD